MTIGWVLWGLGVMLLGAAIGVKAESLGDALAFVGGAMCVTAAGRAFWRFLCEED
jgi:hypothetical protein